MPKTGISTILAIGLLAGSAVGISAQEEALSQVLASDTGDLYCVRASDEVEADRLHEAVVTGAVTITVKPDGECAPGASLHVLSDAEHFGVFMGHAIGSIRSLTAMRNEPRAVPQAGDAEAWLADMAADPEAMAAYMAALDRFVAFAEDELAWLEAHPPRPCWARAHEAWRGWQDQMAALTRVFTTALRAQDVESLIQANADLNALEASGPPDVPSLGTCWSLPAD